MGPPSAKGLPSGAEETILLGRRGVSGIVNASRLASIVRTLRSSVSTHRPTYWLWMSEQGLEVRGPKYDEGFESDDSTSTKSSGGVEEHAGDTSSGVSDLDDQVTSSSDSSLVRVPKELFSIRDIVFCHSDASFPRTLVWVVNGPRRPTPTCLEALVFECRSESSVRRLCVRYQETSKRLKMQMMSLKRTPDVSSTMSSRQEVEHSVPDRLDGVILDRWRDKYVRQREPPSLLSVRYEDRDEWTQVDEPPRRPERRRFVRRKPHEDILRGTFVRVNVDPKPSPVLLKPQFTWMYGVPATAELVLSQSAPVSRSRRSCRSVSPSLSRRMASAQPLR